jgi:acetyl-CoA acetyltransferase
MGRRRLDGRHRPDAHDRGLDGGAIAIGHPLGASGARITAHLVHALHRRNLNTAVGSACIGGGQGLAVLIERI